MIDTILIFFHKIFPNPSKSRAKKPINTANKNANIPPMIFSFSYAPQCGRPHNNWLYRSGPDPLSATNLCYVIFINNPSNVTLQKAYFLKYNTRLLIQISYQRKYTLNLGPMALEKQYNDCY